MSFWMTYIVPFLPVVYAAAGVVKRFAAPHTIAYRIADSIMTGGSAPKAE